MIEIYDQFLRTFSQLAEAQASNDLVDIHQVGCLCGLDEPKHAEIAEELDQDDLLEAKGTAATYRLTPQSRYET